MIPAATISTEFPTRRSLRQARAAVAVAIDVAPHEEVLDEVVPRLAATAPTHRGDAKAASRAVRSRRPLAALVPAGAPAARTSSGRPAVARGASGAKSIAKRGFGVVAFLIAGGIAVATSIPAEAYFAVTPAASLNESVQVQAERAQGAQPVKQQLNTGSVAAASPIDRDSFDVKSVPKLSMAGFNTASTFSNDASGTIQWPFPTGVPISDVFGYRSSPGGIGSTNHQGIDFNPGMGAPIQAVADGTVRVAQRSDNGGFGCHVIIDHRVNGLVFSSLYGHMQCASVQLSKGEAVKVGQQVGNVGSTGTSTGAHLHFEIHDERDTPIDPLPWLTKYAN